MRRDETKALQIQCGVPSRSRLHRERLQRGKPANVGVLGHRERLRP